MTERWRDFSDGGRAFQNVWTSAPGIHVRCLDCGQVMPIEEMPCHECPGADNKGRDETDENTQEQGAT